MKKQFLFATGVLLFSLSTQGQDTTNGKKWFRAHEVFVLAGQSSQRLKAMEFNELRRMNPGSTFLDRDFLCYQIGENGLPIDAPAATLMVGFNLKNNFLPEFTKPKFRLGLTYTRHITIHSSLKKKDLLDSYFMQDKQVFVEIFDMDAYNISHSSDHFSLDASFILSSRPERRITLFSGLGFMAGLGLNGKTNINFSSGMYYQQYNRTEKVWERHTISESRESEKTVTKNLSSHFAYLPLGANVQFGNNSSFWKRLNFCYEFRPGISSVYIPGLKARNNLMYLHLFGLRYTRT